MRKLVFPALILACTLSAQQPATDPAKEAAINDLLATTKADQMVPQMLAQIAPVMRAQMSRSMATALGAEAAAKHKPEIDKFEQDLMDVLAKTMTWEKMKAPLVQIYRDTFSTEELVAITSFYKTPGGAALLTKMPAVAAKSMALGQDLIKDAMPEIMQRAQDFTKELKEQTKQQKP